eukprot:11155035-Lingulodinium_polyedra.AAC.1
MCGQPLGGQPKMTSHHWPGTWWSANGDQPSGGQPTWWPANGWPTDDDQPLVARHLAAKQ